MGAVEGDGDEVLLGTVGVVLKEGDGVSWFADAVTSGRHDAAAQLQCGGELRCFGRTHPPDSHQRLRGACVVVLVQDGEHPSRQGEHVTGGIAASEDDGQ